MPQPSANLRVSKVAERYPRAFGRYSLLAPLAEGGMGALYLACQGERGLEKLCVIKTVLPQLADDEYVARFRDEAKVVVRLSHGNLVPVFDAGTVRVPERDRDEIYLAMEHVDGKDLRAVWNRCAQKGVAFPVDVAAYIARELARGLQHAHTTGDIRLVHRDVSPPNILLSFAGEVKLTDFGLAASAIKKEKTAPGVIYGKVSYMSARASAGRAARRSHRSVRRRGHPVGAAHRAAAVPAGRRSTSSSACARPASSRRPSSPRASPPSSRRS